MKLQKIWFVSCPFTNRILDVKKFKKDVVRWHHIKQEWWILKPKGLLVKLPEIENKRK